MQIYGNPSLSNKFFVYLDDGSVIWTKNFETAKSYVNDPKCTRWYGKPLYCTNEDIVKGYDEKLYVKSEAPKDPNEKVIYDNKSLFVNNTKTYIEKQLEEISKALGYTSFFELISWKDSKIKEYKQLAKDVLDYRDKLYNCFLKCYDKYKEQLEDTSELLDLSNVYDEFLNNIPEFKRSE